LTDAHALRELQRGSADALARLFDKYGAYVATVAYHVISGRMAYEDVEEVTADVFTALWQNAEKAQAAKLKAYLGSIACSGPGKRFRNFLLKPDNLSCNLRCLLLYFINAAARQPPRFTRGGGRLAEYQVRQKESESHRVQDGGQPQGQVQS
jgi:hypothetical protein